MSICTPEQLCELLRKWGNFKASRRSDFAKTKEAKKNEELRDKYKGKRCFIIGNGPSIKEQNLSLLADEIVFVTNNFFRYEKYYDPKPDYYCLADPVFFPKGKQYWSLNGIDGISKYEKKPAFILPYFAKECVTAYCKWDEWASIYYIDAPMLLTASYSKTWDITKPVVFPQNVVQIAMLSATFMGFKEIYLLGVEQTDLIAHLNKRIGLNDIRYAYEYSKNEREIVLNKNKVYEWALEKKLRDYARIFEMYGVIYNYCKQRKIEVFNCTPATLIDSIPKMKYEELFK